MTGGSDYHGPAEDKAASEPGAKAKPPKADAIGLNQLHLPLDLLVPLKQAAAALSPL
jgi:hypothetical protein